MSRANSSTRRVLVVGSWAKEEITIEHLQKTSPVEVFAFLDVANPGIMERAAGYRIGNSSNPDEVLAFAADEDCDLVLVTTAAPLQHGLADRLQEAGISAFAPPREAARLEWDKAFARNLLADCRPSALPRFRICDDVEDACRFSKELDWNIAVKPSGLTEGLGVKVFGDQLESPLDVGSYITEVLERGIGGRHQVLIEERLIGEEFTLQALVDGQRLAPTPAVQDFKKLLPGERGPNTASMGSYAANGRLLPFLVGEQYDEAIEIMRATLAAVEKRTGVSCRGFLYGQFMLTAHGLKLIEYNFRPGDPEWMNTLGTLATPLLDAVTELLQGQEPALEFRDEASVVKYIVPEEYPEKLDEILEARFDRQGLLDLGVHTYYSGGLDEQDRLNVGSERGVALLACAPSVERAHEKIEQAIDRIDGRFFHRQDIGSASLLRSKKSRVDDLLGAGREFRLAREEDAESVHDFAAGCPPLEAYPLHQYKILLRYFGGCSFLASRGGRIEAFEMGLPSHSHPGTYFLWQIGVAPESRGKRLAGRLLEHVEAEVRKMGYERIEVTVDPMNVPSIRLFEAAAYQNISRREGESIEAEGRNAVRDHYGPDRHFLLFEKSLLGAGEDD